MKSFIIIGLLVLVGCSSDPDIMENHPSVPVVYAMINPYDSFQIVRVHKMFSINTKTDWTSLPVDSLVYRDFDVNISGKKGDQIKWTETLIKSVIDRDSGFFLAKDYTIYTLDHPFPIKLVDMFGGYSLGVPDIDSLILEVNVKDLGLTTRASAPVLDPYRIAVEPGGSTIYLFGMHPTHAYLPGGGEDCVPRNDFCFRQIEFRVHYKDYYQDSEADRDISWNTHEGWGLNPSRYELTPDRLLNRMKMLIPDRENVVARRLDSIDIQIIAPSKCFSDYWEVKDYSDDSNIPPFTNFDNSFGLFYTYKIGSKTGMKLNPQSLDTLCKGNSYKEMKFKK
ncbi:MAG: hypothetical protein NTV01_18385 [Bacteroidia bacterium]|nr:hypothetical protein [Bacteroidia bacterium]